MTGDKFDGLVNDHHMKMLFRTSELANKAEITILSARDTTRAWVPGQGIMGRDVDGI